MNQLAARRRGILRFALVVPNNAPDRKTYA